MTQPRYLTPLVILGLLAAAWLAVRGEPAQRAPAGDQLRRGRMSIHWQDEYKRTAPAQGLQETTLKQLTGDVSFQVSEEQLIFFDPNFKTPVPMTHVYGFERATGSPSFNGALGAQLVSWNGTGHYEWTQEVNSGNDHTKQTGVGDGELTTFMVSFSGADFQSVSASVVPVNVITGSRKSQEQCVVSLGLDRGSPPSGWKVNVSHKLGGYVYSVTANFFYSSQTEEYQYEETGSLSLMFDLSGQEELEAVMILPDGKNDPSEKYENWMPEAGQDEYTPGNFMKIRVVLQPKNQPGKLPSRTAKFKFTLVDVSKEPGICMNFPPRDLAVASFDLRIDPASNADLAVLDPMGQSAESTTGLFDSAVKVYSYDYGAWGTLKVTAILDDGTQVFAHLKDKPDIEALSIPKDDNENHVADAWENLMSLQGTSADSDEDQRPKGNGDAGDGLSLFEEYRGFMINGQHFRTDPNYKDVFVYDQDQMSLGDYAASGLDVHSVRQEETYKTTSQQNQLIINFNHGYAHLGDKFVLLLKDDPSLSARGLLGLADCGPAGDPHPGLPKTCRSIGVAMDDNLQLQTNHPFRQLISTIAHELAHGSNVWHHGDKDYTIKMVYQDGPDGSVQVNTGSWGVSVVGGQESGVEDCIMRYNGNTFYESAGGSYYWHRGAALVHGVVYPPVEPDGTVFCDSKVGTGVNDPQGGKLPDGRPLPKAGNATRGDCMHQFSVNDLK